MADKMIQIASGSDNLYPVCSPVKTATLTGTYISSGSVSWMKSGRLVVFSATFTPNQTISSSVGELFPSTNMPVPLYSGNYLCKNNTSLIDGTTVRVTPVTIYGHLYPIGSYAANTEYHVSGAYISAT